MDKLKHYSPVLLAAGTAISLWIVQTKLANYHQITIRLLLNWMVITAITFTTLYIVKTRVRETIGSAPDPATLVLCGLVALGVWPAAWWLMDLTNHYGPSPIDAPRHITRLSDHLLGLNLQPVAYELHVLFSVILLPLVIAWLLWGVIQPDLVSRVGRWRTAWFMSLFGGLFLTLIAIQKIAPGMPWGLASVGGYVLIASAAAWVVYFIRSFWAGFAVYGTYAYANFALEDNLFRAMLGKGYLDPAWLTLIVLGGAGALFVLQLIRFRLQPTQQRDQESEQAKRS